MHGRIYADLLVNVIIPHILYFEYKMYKCKLTRLLATTCDINTI